MRFWGIGDPKKMRFEGNCHQNKKRKSTTELFDAIPAQLNSNASRYHVSSVLGGSARADDLLKLIAEMKDSKTVLISYHANNPN